MQIKYQFKDKYTQYKMNEIVILFANTKLNVSSSEQFITLVSGCTVLD